MKKTTILSLDGGGIRGIITCIILRYIEEQLQYYDKPGAKLGDILIWWQAVAQEGSLLPLFYVLMKSVSKIFYSERIGIVC